MSIDTPQQALGGGEFLQTFRNIARQPLVHLSAIFGVKIKKTYWNIQNSSGYEKKHQLPPMLHTTLPALTEHFKRKVHSAKMARAGI